MPAPIDLTGERFGKLLAVRLEHINPHGQSMWFCVCECGVQRIVASHNLRSGRTQSCGCLRGRKRPA